MPPADPHLQHIESALRLWGVAFRDVTMNRRKNILRQTAPDFLNLLSDPTMFSNREMSRLFSVHFLNAMAKEADEENKIAKIGRSGRHSLSSRRPFNKYTRVGGVAPQKSFAGPSSSGNSRGTGSNSQRASGSVYSVFSAVINSPYPPVGGRLSQFTHAWRYISSDPFVLNVISMGVSLDFVSLPSQSTLPTNCKMSLEMELACDAEISDLCAKRAILPIHESSGYFFSSIFLVPKKTGGYRPIINLKNLNSHIRFEHFKMEGMESVRQLIHRGDWMVKLDLKDAYLSVPISLEHQPFLCFRWRNMCYKFTCLAFGLSPAPRLSTKLLKPVVSALRRAGIRLVIYLDDIIFMNENREGVISDVTAAINLLISLGFLINWEKSVLLPSQSLEFLGLLVDSVVLSLALPSDKVLSMLALCRRSLLKDVISLHELSSLIGSFSWAIPTIPFAQAHYRQLQRLYIYHSKSFNYDLSRYVSLSPAARDDIRWWVENLSASNGLCFLKQDPDLIIYSDASLQGWGFACDGVYSRGPWAGTDRLRHINELELLAAFYALKSLTAQSTNLKVNLILDNSTAVSYINKRGGTRSRALCDISSSIVSWCESRDLSLTATHLPGILNSIADEQSRTSLDASDWLLCRSAFRKLMAVWKMDVDLFATKWNAQLPTFVSWMIQPDAFALNAFSLNWGRFKGYAFPPFALIARCLAKLRKEKAELVLVCPLWFSQPWFPLLLNMACDTPLIFRFRPDLLVSCSGAPHPLTINNSLILSAWKLSGDVSSGKAFRRTWSTYCWQVTETPRQLLINQHGGPGVVGIIEGIRIPCLAL